MGVRDPVEPYRQSQREHGDHFRVTLWANERSQRIRFDVMTQMVFLVGKRILDAGCSRGDFASFLLKRRIAFEHYVGVDAVCEVIDYAQGRNLERCAFHCGDLLGEPDLWRRGNPQVICISGTLNTMDDQQVDRLLSSAWDAAGETLVFNFLSDRAAAKAPLQYQPARRLDTLHMLDWATRRTWNVLFRQDYFRFGHDATIVMRKD